VDLVDRGSDDFGTFEVDGDFVDEIDWMRIGRYFQIFLDRYFSNIFDRCFQIFFDR